MKVIKKLMVTAAGVSLVSLVLIAPMGTRNVTATQEVSADKPAEYYKAKCVACHGPKAEKKFDATLSDDAMLEAVLKGKKAEKPPNMPGFAAKGVSADQAKALIEFMKQLKASAAN
jgi:mono/diheme cytochrome c family protein